MNLEEQANRFKWAKETLAQLMEPHVKEAIMKLSLIQPSYLQTGEMRIIITETEQDILNQLIEAKQMYMQRFPFLRIEEILLEE